MGWTMREAVEVVLSGRRAARRNGSVFVLDRERMFMAGFQPSEIAEVEQAANDIEKFKEDILSKLKRVFVRCS